MGNPSSHRPSGGSCERSKQAPTSRQGRAKSAAGKYVVVKVPDCCLSRAGVFQNIIGRAVPVEIAHCRQEPPAGQSRAIGAREQTHSGQIPNRGLDAGLDAIGKQVIWFAIAIKIRHSHHHPAIWQGRDQESRS